MHRLDVLAHMLILNTCLLQAFERKKKTVITITVTGDSYANTKHVLLQQSKTPT